MHKSVGGVCSFLYLKFKVVYITWVPTISGVFLSLAELLGSVGFLHNQPLKKRMKFDMQKKEKKKS